MLSVFFFFYYCYNYHCCSQNYDCILISTTLIPAILTIMVRTTINIAFFLLSLLFQLGYILLHFLFFNGQVLVAFLNLELALEAKDERSLNPKGV